MRRMNLKALAAAAAVAVSAASGAVAQTTVFSETWEGATGPFPFVINDTGNAIGTGQNFQADNLWTADPVITVGIDAGPHVAVSLVEDSGDVTLEWNADDLDGADNDAGFSAPIATPFSLDTVESFTLTADIVVRATGTNGGRDSTFYIGADTENYFAVQLVTRNTAGGEVIEVEWANAGADLDVKFGDGQALVGGGTIVADGIYRLEATFTPGDLSIALAVSLTDTVSNTEILSGTHDIPVSEAPAGDALLDTFIGEGKRRMYHNWADLSVVITEPTAEGEGEGAGEGEGEGEGGPEPFTVSFSGPSSATRQIGGSASFSVSASGNTGALDYQWYEGTPAKASELISGATNATLTLSNLTLDMSGPYYCAVTDDNETVNSPLFTLVVVGTALPAAGLAGLMAAGVLTALAASVALRRRSA